MRIGNLEIGRRRQFATVKAPPQGELGVDSDHWLNRWAGGGPDPNVILTGTQKFQVYDEMALSDASCKTLLQMIKLPLTGAIWDAEPASEDPVDQVIANAIRWQFGLKNEDGQLDQTWRATLEQKLLKLRYGCMFEEIVWGDPVTFTDPDTGETRLIRPIKRLAPRLPRTIIDVEYEAGKIARITQNLAMAKPIPAEKLAYYVIDAQPGRWDGTSMLRAAWGPWEMKKQLMISAGIAWDRWAAGFPEIRYPLSGGSAEQAVADEMGRSIRNHERGYVSFQGPPPSDLNPDGWGIDIKGGPGNLPDPVPLLKQYGYEILSGGLMAFMALGNTHSGSRAVGQVQDEPYYMAVEAFATDLGLEIQRQCWRRFVDVNFGTEYATPACKASKIQSEDVAQLATTLSNLKLAGFDFSDMELQNDVRERMHLPDLPEDWVAPGATEGSGLPAVPARVPVDTSTADKQQAQLRAAERREERLHRQLERTVDGLIKRLNSAPEPLPLPAPAAPIVIPITAPASTTEPQLVRLLEEAQTRMLEQLGVERELPPIHLEIKQGNKRSIVSKDADGNTVVEQQDV